MADLGLRQQELSSRGGPSPATVRALFKAGDNDLDFKALQPETQLKFDVALEWEAGSTRDVLAGGEPRPTSARRGSIEVRGRDIEAGTVHLVVPAEVLEDMSPSERTEAEHRMIAAFLATYREIRATRPVENPSE